MKKIKTYEEINEMSGKKKKKKAKKISDLTFGIDLRGDDALFIEDRHFSGDEVDSEVKQFISQMKVEGEIFPEEEEIFFRVIEDGVQTDSHGWLNIDVPRKAISVLNWG